jgi:hypothetical protein
MELLVTIPKGLPPGHSVRVEGAFTGGPSAAPLSGDREVSGGREIRAGVEALGGRLRRPRLRRKRFNLHREGGRFSARRFGDSRFDPLPELSVETDEIRGFGTYTFELRTIDERGEPSGGTASQTVLVAPPPLGVSNVAVSYDNGTDTATFSFVHGSLLE